MQNNLLTKINIDMMKFSETNSLGAVLEAGLRENISEASSRRFFLNPYSYVNCPCLWIRIDPKDEFFSDIREKLLGDYDLSTVSKTDRENAVAGCAFRVDVSSFLTYCEYADEKLMPVLYDILKDVSLADQALKGWIVDINRLTNNLTNQNQY